MRRPVATPRVSSGCWLAVKRFALGAAHRRLGDGGASDPLCEGQVEAGPRLVGNRDRNVLLQATVADGLICGVVLPAAPEHANPGSSKGADRAGMVVAGGSGGGVVLLRPGLPMAGGVGEGARRGSQAVVAAAAKAGGLAFARLDGDRCHAGVGRQRFGARVAGAAVADLGEQRAGADDRFGVFEQPSSSQSRRTGLAARRSKARACRRDLIGMDRHHPQPCVQQPLDQQPVRSLDRDQLDVQLHERVAQRSQPALVMRERALKHALPISVLHEDVVLLRGPVDAGVPGCSCSSRFVIASQRPDREVPSRVLIDGPSTGLRPVAACGISPRREEQVSCWPSNGQATMALTRRGPRQPEDDQ